MSRKRGARCLIGKMMLIEGETRREVGNAGGW